MEDGQSSSVYTISFNLCSRVWHVVVSVFLSDKGTGNQSHNDNRNLRYCLAGSKSLSEKKTTQVTNTTNSKLNVSTLLKNNQQQTKLNSYFVVWSGFWFWVRILNLVLSF